MTGKPEPGDLPGESWWTRLRRALRTGAELVAEIVGRPQPEPVLYLRCDSCGQVAPRTTVRHHGQLDFRTGLVESAPPEHPCPLCGAYSPRVVGDQVEPDDRDVAAATVTCSTRFGCLQFWRRCRTTFTAPAEAVFVLCPACGRRYPGRAG